MRVGRCVVAASRRPSRAYLRAVRNATAVGLGPHDPARGPSRTTRGADFEDLAGNPDSSRDGSRANRQSPRIARIKGRRVAANEPSYCKSLRSNNFWRRSAPRKASETKTAGPAARRSKLPKTRGFRTSRSRRRPMCAARPGSRRRSSRPIGPRLESTDGSRRS